MALCIMSKCECVCVWGVAQVGFKVGYDIPKNVGMTRQWLKGKHGSPVFKVSWRPWRTLREKGIRVTEVADCSRQGR